jgi:hypothetical protein
MKTHYKHKPFWVRDKPKPTFSDSHPQLERLWTLSQWLLLFPIVMLILFSCGQIGILTSRKIAEANLESYMIADYGPWSYVLIHPFKPEIIEDIIQDKQNEDAENAFTTEKDESDEPWLDQTPKPTAIARVEPTRTFTNIPNDENQPLPTETTPPQPIPTETTTSQPSPTEAPQHSATPIPTQSQPTITPSPIPSSTSIPAVPPPPPDLPTNTPVTTVSNTYWFSSDHMLNGYALSPNQPNGPSSEGTIQLRYFTEPMPEEATIQAGKCNLTFYVSNSTDQNWEIGFFVSAGTSIWPTLGGTTLTIPANTATPTLYTKNFHIISHTFSEGQRLAFTFSLPPFVTIYWDGEWNDAGLVVPPITP